METKNILKLIFERSLRALLFSKRFIVWSSISSTSRVLVPPTVIQETLSSHHLSNINSRLQTSSQSHMCSLQVFVVPFMAWHPQQIARLMGVERWVISGEWWRVDGWICFSGRAFCNQIFSFKEWLSLKRKLLHNMFFCCFLCKHLYEVKMMEINCCDVWGGYLADLGCFTPPGKDEEFLQKTTDKTQQIYVGTALWVVLMGIVQSEKNSCFPSAFPETISLHQRHWDWKI